MRRKAQPSRRHDVLLAVIDEERLLRNRLRNAQRSLEYRPSRLSNPQPTRREEGSEEGLETECRDAISVELIRLVVEREELDVPPPREPSHDFDGIGEGTALPVHERHEILA